MRKRAASTSAPVDPDGRRPSRVLHNAAAADGRPPCDLSGALMRHPVRTLAAAGLIVLLAGCGGDASSSSDGGDAAAESSAAEASASQSSAAAEASASADAEMMVIDVESEAKNVGFDVANWAIDHDFTNPKNQAEFEKSVKYDKSLSPDSKAGYQPAGQTFKICVTRFADGKPAAWAIYDGESGLSEGEAGAPTEAFCPQS